MRLTRWLLIAGILLLVVVLMWQIVREFGDVNSGVPGLPSQTSSQGDAPEPAGPASPQPSETAQPAQADPVLNVPTPVIEVDPLFVDSYPVASQLKLEAWESFDFSMGHFDVLTVEKVPHSAGKDGQIAILVAQGWAGETQLGMRLQDVFLSMCGLVIARANILQDRPDVARAVHPNLLRSGWQARIYPGDLPSCASRQMSAWSIVPGNPARLMRLNTTHEVPGLPLEPIGDLRVSAQSDLDPGTYPTPLPTSIRIDSRRVNLRRCGGTDCEIVGQVDRGEYSAVLIEDTEEWTLTTLNNLYGWIFKDLYRVVE